MQFVEGATNITSVAEQLFIVTDGSGSSSEHTKDQQEGCNDATNGAAYNAAHGAAGAAAALPISRSSRLAAVAAAVACAAGANF